VLPFENRSGDPNLDWLSQGIAQGLADKLRRVPPLRTVDPSLLSSALAESKAYPQSREALLKIGKTSSATTLLLGNYRTSKDELLVEAQVVRVETGQAQDISGLS